MTKCLNLDGLSRWAAVLMVVDTTTIPTLLSADATVLFPLTSTSLDAHQPPRHYCTVSSSSKRRSTGARISFTGGPSEAIVCSCCCSLCYISSHLTYLSSEIRTASVLGFANLLLYLEGCMPRLFDKHGTHVLKISSTVMDIPAVNLYFCFPL